MMPTKTSAGPNEGVRLEVLRLTPPLPPGGAGSPRARFFFAKAPSDISEGTKTGLQTPRANRYHSSYQMRGARGGGAGRVGVFGA
jgi:hypothetical protein